MTTISLYTGAVPALNQSQPVFDTNTQAFIDYISTLAPDINAFATALNTISTTTSSVTSNSISIAQKTFTVEAGKSFFVGMSLRAAFDATNYMNGEVVSYSGTTLVINVLSIKGSGTYAVWAIFQSQDSVISTEQYENLSITNAKLAFDGGAFSFKNDLINGNFELDQEFVGASTSHADDTYAQDGWYVLTQTAAISTAQQTDQENGTPFNIRMTQTQAAAQRMGLAQIVESKSSKKRRGSAMVESLRIRASNGQAIRYAILEWTGTADAVTSDVVLDWTSASYTAGGFFLASNLVVTAIGTITPTANTWTDVTALTGTFGSTVNNSIVMVWTEGTAAQNFTLDISRFQLEKGTTATPFENIPTLNGLIRAQRFWEKSYELATAIGTATGIGDESVRRVVTGETSTLFNTTFKVEKISIPTMTWYNPSTGTINQIFNATGAANLAITGTNANVPVSSKKSGAPSHAANGAAGDIIIGQWVANSRL